MFLFMLGPVSNSKEKILFEVTKGQTYSTLGSSLKEKKLIKSEFAYKIYIKLANPKTLEACVHELNQNMSVSKIIESLSESCNKNPDALNITFKEGLNIRQIASLIETATANNKEDVFEVLKDKEYINSLIAKYWFLDESINNKEIYYPLEGYLYPNTYQFLNEEVSVKTIFETLLNETDKVLTKYKADIEKSEYSLHEILTLASIIELEAANSGDRAGVAGVFYNRLEDNWSLGSDVTTYYAEKIDMSERDLYQSELDDYNAYNTRSAQMAGKLPVSPICNPSLESIVAAISPTDHDYYYFVADKNKKTYFNKTSAGHDKTVRELKEKGLWYTY